MRVDRRFLYWGVFFVAMGAVMVAVDLRALDPSRVLDALSLWPLAIVVVGVAILVRRTRANPAAWVVAAALPGLVLGGAVAAAPRVVIDCGSAAPTITQDVAGSFSGPATVDVTAGCGTLQVGTTAGSAWAFAGGNTANGSATVYQTPTSLSLVSTNRPRPFGFGSGGRDLWRLTLPTSQIQRLNLQLTAGDGTVNLNGAQIDSLQTITNAGRLVVDLTGASVPGLTATLNAGDLAIQLPAGQDISASFVANAGRLRVCVPAGVGIQVQRTGVLGSMTFGGLQANGNLWQSPDYGSAAHHADLTVHVNVAGIEINPIGGCK